MATVIKNTLTNQFDNGIVECVKKDDGMLAILADLGKHTPFSNAKGDKTTLLKTGWIERADGSRLNVQYQEANQADFEAKQARNVAQKISKLINGKATEGDIAYLGSHGFSNDTGDGLDMGRVESVHLDNVARQARERAAKAIAKSQKDAQAKMTANNGSFTPEAVADAQKRLDALKAAA